MLAARRAHRRWVFPFGRVPFRAASAYLGVLFFILFDPYRRGGGWALYQILPFLQALSLLPPAVFARLVVGVAASVSWVSFLPCSPDPPVLRDGTAVCLSCGGAPLVDLG